MARISRYMPPSPPELTQQDYILEKYHAFFKVLFKAQVIVC